MTEATGRIILSQIAKPYQTELLKLIAQRKGLLRAIEEKKEDNSWLIMNFKILTSEIKIKEYECYKKICDELYKYLTAGELKTLFGDNLQAEVMNLIRNNEYAYQNHARFRSFVFCILTTICLTLC